MKKLIALLLAATLCVSGLCVGTVATVAETTDPSPDTPFVEIDGVLDDTYYPNRVIEDAWWFNFDGNTTPYVPLDPERVVNTLHFTWDDDFVYFYFECVSQDPLYKPEEGEVWPGTKPGFYHEAISVYIDTAPSLTYAAECQSDSSKTCQHFYCNCNDGEGKYYRLQTRTAPAWGNWWNYFRSDEGMFLTREEFAEKREGEKGYEDLDAMYALENGACEAVSFIDYETGTYGCELKYPRYEGEEYFRCNFTTNVNEINREDEGYEIGYTKSACASWWMNYEGMFVVHYADYPAPAEDGGVVDGEVAAIKRMISELPDPIGVDDVATVENIEYRYNRLTDAQKDQITEDEVAKMNAALARIDVLKVAATIGNVDGAGEINASDALCVLRAAVGKLELTDEQKVSADVNDDGEINAADALDILKFAVKKLDTFVAVKNLLK